MDFLLTFRGTGLFVLLGGFLGMALYGIAYVCGMPFDPSRFVTTGAVGGFLGTVLLLWASVGAKPPSSTRETFEILLASLLWWALLAALVLAHAVC